MAITTPTVHMPFNEASGNYFDDIVGTVGFTPGGSTHQAAMIPFAGQSCSTDGVNDFLNMGSAIVDGVVPDMNADWSFALIWRGGTLGTSEWIFNRNSGGAANNYFSLLTDASTGTNYSIGYGDGSSDDGTATIATSGSQLVIGRFNATTFELWVDGTLDATATVGAGTFSGSVDMRIGVRTTGTGFIEGFFGDLSIWGSHRLTDSEIVQLYNGGSYETHPFGGGSGGVIPPAIDPNYSRIYPTIF